MAPTTTSNLEELRKAQRATGPAAILAIGTATPNNPISQADYPDYYFRVTNSDHMTDLKAKFKRICDKSTIKTRYMQVTEEFLKRNPNMCSFSSASLDTRQELVVVEVPKLGKEAAVKAIEEWGQPISNITHLIFCTFSGVDMPGADYQLTKILGLPSSINRYMIYQQGCFAGGTVVRLAKDLAENNKGARVLVVCSEMTAIHFRGPSPTSLDNLVGQAIFGDGAAALIVGSDPDPSIEHPLYHIVSATQTIVPNSEGSVLGHLREEGLTFHLSKDLPELITTNIEHILVEAFSALGMISEWNSVFWVVHTGGPAILDQMEAKLGLKKEKLKATRQVLRDYGNMSSASVFFVLDEMRNRSVDQMKATTGEGLEWGVLLGIGPGLTIETIVLHSVPVAHPDNGLIT